VPPRQLNRSASTLEMEDTDSNVRILPLLKWSPLCFAFAFAVLLISLWRERISVTYLIACGVVGLLGWLLISFGYSKHRLNLALTVCIFLLPLGMIVRYLFFSPLEASSWGVFSQYGAVVYAVIFGLTWAFRHRIKESLRKRDAEQIVGRERRERVSYHD
jgi:multidrug transporter EmrE-like cation transporter